MASEEDITDICKAAREGNQEVVDRLIVWVDVNSSLVRHQDVFYTALICASCQGHASIVDSLIRAGATQRYIDYRDFNDNYHDGFTALMCASEKGHGSIVGSLIRAGASLNIRNTDGFTALMCASEKGHVSIVDSLIRAGASVDIQGECMQDVLDDFIPRINPFVEVYGNDVFCRTALMCASEKGHGSIVGSLIRAGASVDIQNYNGRTALIYASRGGHGSTVDSLIGAGASLDTQDKKGYTALIFASSQGYGSIVGSLIRAGASIDTQDNEGYTALIYASREGYDDIMESLLQHYRAQCFIGVDPAAPPPRGNAPAADPIARDVVSISRALCVTTLLADDSVYLNFETTQELVEVLHAEYNIID